MSSQSSYEPLRGAEGNHTPVTRHRGTVSRPVGPWTGTVHARLENAGFVGGPRLLGDGYDDQGRDADGAFSPPRAWSDAGIWRVGRQLGELRDATASFVPPQDAVWQLWAFHSDARGAIISHRDAGPPAVRVGLPVAFIDKVSAAGPIDRLDEIAWWERATARRRHRRAAQAARRPGAGRRAAPLPRRLWTGHR